MQFDYSYYFAEFLEFMVNTYGFFLPTFICLSLIETALIILNHAMLGHGLKLTWLYGSKPNIDYSSEVGRKASKSGSKKDWTDWSRGGSL